jgi:hypothetical protein
MRPSGATQLLLTALLAVACAPPPPVDQAGLVPKLVMDRVRFSVDREGKTRATGVADRVVYRRDTGDVAATGLSIVLGEAWEGVLVTAPAGSGSTVERRFQVSGGVRAVRGRDVATTGSARLEPATQPGRPALVLGEEPVVVEGAGYRLTGTGFTLDPQAGDIVLHGRPRLLTGLGARR